MVTQSSNGTVIFEFFRPNVQQMAIAGDFNGWQHSFQMARGHDGWWRSQIQLAPGTYRFRYMGDGQWFTDYAAFGVEPGPFGWNSVLIVEAAEVAAQPIESPVGVREAARLQPAAKSPAKPDDSEWSEPTTPHPVRRTRRRPVLVGHS